MVDWRPRLDFHHGDHRHSSDSDELQNKDDKWKTKKQTTSRLAGDSHHLADKTLHSVIIVEPQTDTITSSSSGERAAGSVRTTASTSDSSRRTENHEEPRGFEETSNYFRQRCSGNEDPGRRKVKSEGQQRPIVLFLACAYLMTPVSYKNRQGVNTTIIFACGCRPTGLHVYMP